MERRLEREDGERAECDLVWGPQARLELGSSKSITICGGSIILLIYLWSGRGRGSCAVGVSVSVSVSVDLRNSA